MSNSELDWRETDKRIIGEVQKQGREFLYKLEHFQYQNTLLKRKTWTEIGKTVGISATECMKRWKLLRSLYVRTLKTLQSETARPSKNLWIIHELDFLKSEIKLPVNDNLLPLASPTSPISRVLKLKDGSEVLIQSRKNRLILPKPIPTVIPNTRPEILAESPEPVIKKIKSQPVPETPKPNKHFERAAQNVDEETAYEQFGKYVAAELRLLPPREAILLQQELLNSITRVKLTCLDSSYSNGPELLHVDVASHTETSSTSSNSPIDSKSDDFDVLGQAMITTFGGN